MSPETLEYIMLEVPLPNISQELRGMKENSWLAGYKDWDKLPDGAKIVFVSQCEIAHARSRMKEIGKEIPGSEDTPDSGFSWYHIHYGEGDAEEYVVPARWCVTPGTFFLPEENCYRVFNRVRYEDILRYAAEWKQEHPEKAECFTYAPAKPPEEATPSTSSGEFSEPITIRKWWNGKGWEYEKFRIRRRP